MKPRNFNKKLSLNKKTIAHLNNYDMKTLRGGIDPVTHTCSEGKPCPDTYTQVPYATCTCFTNCYYSICTECIDCAG